ncbi:uncharacterized protein PG986_004420 [Apiospora aurea]|uniref:WSC domain-containing protein n=1 Tax=Apiospora aurea TaxID=335848 RepID=A0ABR1QMJ0_9PEZI
MWSTQLSPLARLVLPAAMLAVAQVQAASLNYVGCFSSAPGFVDLGPNPFQSRGLCANRCRQMDQWIVGLANGTNCLCGANVPPTRDIAGDRHCNMPCSGYAMETCGGLRHFTILIRDITQLQQHSGSMSEKLPGLRAGS